MKFNSNGPYIEYDSDDNPCSIYETNGINRINELTRQLRTFLNYKAAIIKYRFRPNTINQPTLLDIKSTETSKKLKQNASEFIKQLKKIKGKGISYECELIRMLERVRFAENVISNKLLTDMKETTQNLFTIIHELSEREIHLQPNLLKFTINLTQDACKVFKIFNSWALEFYEELRVNYHQLYDELTLLIQNEGVEKIVRERRSLEGRLKEW
jgi:hypothetical protein